MLVRILSNAGQVNRHKMTATSSNRMVTISIRFIADPQCSLFWFHIKRACSPRSPLVPLSFWTTIEIDPSSKSRGLYALSLIECVCKSLGIASKESRPCVTFPVDMKSTELLHVYPARRQHELTRLTACTYRSRKHRTILSAVRENGKLCNLSILLVHAIYHPDGIFEIFFTVYTDY